MAAKETEPSRVDGAQLLELLAKRLSARVAGAVVEDRLESLRGDPLIAADIRGVASVIATDGVALGYAPKTVNDCVSMLVFLADAVEHPTPESDAALRRLSETARTLGAEVSPSATARRRRAR